MNRFVARCSLLCIFSRVQYNPRWKRRLKEVLWRLLLSLMDVHQNDFENVHLFTDLKDELRNHMREKKFNETFTLLHLISHIEGIRYTVPLDQYQEHRQWVFNEFPHLIPSFANLLGSIVVAFTKGVVAL